MTAPLRVTTCQARNTFSLMDGVTRHIQRELGVRAVYVDDIPWQERYAQLSSGQMHLVWICARPFAEHVVAETNELVGLAVPVMQGELYAGEPVYYSHLVVHRDQPASSLEALAGTRIAFNEPGSQSGYYSLKGATSHLPDSHFAAWVESGSHAESLRLLATREVDVAAIDSTFWEFEAARGSEHLTQLRTIGLLGPFAAPPLVAHASLPESLRQEIRDCVLSMHEDARRRQVLHESQVDRFVPVRVDDYRSLVPDA